MQDAAVDLWQEALKYGAPLLGVLVGGLVGHLSGYRLARLQLREARAQRDADLRRATYARLAGLAYDWASEETGADRIQIAFLAASVFAERFTANPEPLLIDRLVAQRREANEHRTRGVARRRELLEQLALVQSLFPPTPELNEALESFHQTSLPSIPQSVFDGVSSKEDLDQAQDEWLTKSKRAVDEAYGPLLHILDVLRRQFTS